MQNYVGRFAPSPSGALHFGSLIAATASYLDARANKGLWLVRIDDLDTPRVVQHAIPTLLQQLEDYGFHWDKAVFYQSQHPQRYEDALQQLLSQQQAYPCDCSRKQLQQRTGSTVYDGFCRHKQLTADRDHAIRYKIDGRQPLSYPDLIQGEQSINPITSLGDFIIKRRDGFIGYHLACALDDLEQGITHVIRGYDLMGSSFAQQLITHAFAAKTLAYGHHPIAVNNQQVKLSKSAASPAIVKQDAIDNLFNVLKFLNQNPPAALQTANLDALWQWAIANWQRDRIPAKAEIGHLSL
ncbi:tRNA glutamyl-Q(34) synthetase GluQRS [Thiomicrospira microaerophila]|uniref:tRNA glutamyl-Q(34) synthetase GluQRS n=1 Tax=Thiomicrospira microaerophila TaxID=406020 RepID=UPI0005CB5BFA|nr:tRNA glutamyl-Q(34) synthetase GluQRS [Thiomicrospira microaerophila]